MNLQPLDLVNDFVALVPLEPENFEILFQVACDPLIWEQHPNKDRYKKEVFQKYFESGLESKGAFLIYDNKTDDLIGSTRYYEYDPEKRTVAIGFTFFSRNYWSSGYNRKVKILMLNHAFQYVDTVIFHIAAYNIRSQKAIEKLGAIRAIDENRETEFPDNPNFTFKIEKIVGKVIIVDQ